MKENKLFKLILLVLLTTIFSTFSIKNVVANKGVVNIQQQFSVVGTVSDENNFKSPGVTVLNKKTKQTVVTNVDGGYSIRASNGDTIQVRMTGYATQTFVARDTRKRVDISLKEDVQLLRAVQVTTALGIKRSEKELGYAVTQVDGDDINKAKETNIMNSLSGKVAGLVINSGAGGPAGSSRVVIRGATSITGNNQPLYVVDGIPMDNSNYGQVGTDQYGAGVDMGDAISAINPDDIESISVLKGPAAAALYGSLAGNGVILITTKKGTNNKELGIDFNSTNTIETQLTRYDDVQYLYGQGRNQLIPTDQATAFNSLFVNFGARLDPNISYVGFDGITRPYALVENNIQNFFRTGSSFNNTIALSSSTDKSSFRFSAADLRYDDIVPASDIRRNTYTFSGRSKFGNKLTLDVRASYMDERVNNRAGLGDSPSNIGWAFNGLANNIDQQLFATNYTNPQGDYLDWGGGQFRLNPYWVINEMYNKTDKDRLTGALNATYQFTKAFSINAKAATDITFLDYESYRPMTTPGALGGQLDQTKRTFTTNQVEVLASYTKQVNKDFNLSARMGGSINKRIQKGTVSAFSNMVVKDAITPGSYIDKSVLDSYIPREIRSVYGLVTVGFKNYLFLDATIRNDVSSTLPDGNNSYTYPSLSASFAFTDAFNIKSDILSFGKLRASIAEVGSDTDPFMLDMYYMLNQLPFNGQLNGKISSNVIPPSDLRPTRTRSIEFGTNMRFFKNKINFDATFYKSDSRDQINRVPAPESSGFTNQLINAGVITNHGIELLISGSPLSNKSKVKWNVSVNFARNRSEIKSLSDRVGDFLTLSQARWAGLQVVAKPGEQYATLMGTDFKRDPDGNVILNSSSLLPIIDPTLRVLGKGIFDWTGGITNRVSYGNFSLGAALDVKFGADMFSMTNLFLHARGSANATLEGREEWILSEERRLAEKKTFAQWQAEGKVGGFVPKGVINTGTEANPVYVTNTRAMDPSLYWSTFVTDGSMVAPPFVYKASYVKVRELTFIYTLPQTLNKKLGVKGASLGLVARNPFIIYKDVPNVDPDSNYNNSNGQGLEYGSLPTRRGWGFNLNVKF
ncbi:MAG: SusC/RagA family TonB-linked outer membrane protein [Pedobacter sp.]|uniref:SusC/RagA family TonB-linked outer membrane protein n=1 Tax=Pedobacter sp. TaxID=1411316 RepID=UPI002809BC7A|nr:SusC/RagA family TonB-linked outer membrane protein [Pedobacter sp.]MDQ8003558.1 SusC/RagA family TonB-linked outer membrane protein [Pedobacter sp.]